MSVCYIDNIAIHPAQVNEGVGDLVTERGKYYLLVTGSASLYAYKVSEGQDDSHNRYRDNKL